MTKKDFVLFRRQHYTKFSLVVVGILINALSSCNEKNEGEINNNYDPNAPVVVERVLPTEAKFNENFIIQGKNFGSDVSKIEVLFENKLRKAIVISSDGTTIYGLVPRQTTGVNDIVLVVDGNVIETDKTISYQEVTTTSVFTGAKTERAYTDGTLSEARFQSSPACAFVADGNLIVSELGQSRLRLVSEKDNQVTTLVENMQVGKPGVNKEGNKAYVVGFASNAHAVWELTKEHLWVPKKIRTAPITESQREVWACDLDDSEEWLYFVDEGGKFIRMNLENTDLVEVLIDGLFTSETGTKIESDFGGFIIWSDVDKCFFVSSGHSNNLAVIYKVWEEAGIWKKEVYAGMLGKPNFLDGYRLDEALIYRPKGMTLDVDGNLYFADGGGDKGATGHRFRKIDRATGMITTVAGSGYWESIVQSEPLKTSFWNPNDITVDTENNFILADELEGWWIKLAIE